MQKILGYMRKAIVQYNMIQDGDKVAVGVSGGKDSVILLAGLAQIRKFIGIDFDIIGITLDPCFGQKETDYSKIESMCKKYNIEYIVERTNIGPIVFDYRKESNPCSLCSRMRRGALHDLAIKNGCNKIALGHHSDDWMETFFMNLFNEGRIGTFLPVTYLSRKNIHTIRPLILASEREIVNVIRKSELPVVKSVCPADGHSNREWTKKYLVSLEQQIPGVKKKILGAIIRNSLKTSNASL